jgi:ATP-dependent RNA helicase DHX29
MTKKKKKAAAPAVSRGFATSSIASKQQRVDLDEEQSKKLIGKVPDSSSAATEQSSTTTDTPEQEPKQQTAEEYQAELERTELQQYVESHGPKVVKESQRQLSKLHTDSRVLRAQSLPLNTWSWLTEELQEEILNVARQSLSRKQGFGIPKKQPDDVWVDRFWTLFKVLDGMGIPRERIFQLFQELPMQDNLSDSSNVWGLRQSLDILALDTELQVPSYNKPRQPQNEKEPMSGAEPDSEPEPPRRLGKTLKSQTNSQIQTPLQSGAVTPLMSTGEEDFDVSDLGSDLEPDDLVQIYVSTKLTLFKRQPSLVENVNLKRTKSAASRSSSVPRTSGIRKLQDKLRRIEADILFDRDVAYQKWNDARIEYLQTRSTQPESMISSPRLGPSIVEDKPEDKLEDKPKDTKKSLDQEGPEESELPGLLGEMFLEPGQETSTESNQDEPPENVTIRDFGKVTGYNPRRMLEEACRAR